MVINNGFEKNPPPPLPPKEPEYIVKSNYTMLQLQDLYINYEGIPHHFEDCFFSIFFQ